MKKYIFTVVGKFEIFKKMSEYVIWNDEWYKSDKRFDCIFVKHQDGSEVKVYSTFLEWAKMENTNVDILLLFPEHLSKMFFFLDDLELVEAKKGNEIITIHKQEYENT